MPVSHASVCKNTGDFPSTKKSEGHFQTASFNASKVAIAGGSHFMTVVPG